MFEPPESLVTAIRERKLVPFVGAGVSVGTVVRLAEALRFPDWNGLIGRLTAKLRAEGRAQAADAADALLPDTMAAAEAAVDQLGRQHFLDVMRQAFDRPTAPIGADLSAVQAIW